jgi:hypothetical protein
VEPDATEGRMVDFDSPWKEALDGYLESFIALFFPEMHAEIDWTRGYETLDKELQQITPRMAADTSINSCRFGD